MLLDRSAMSCASQGWVFIAVLLSGLGAGGSSAFAQERGGRWYDLEHLTGPSTRDPAQTYRRYLERNRDRMGMTNVDLDKLVVRNRYISSRTGTTHLYMRQQIHGIPVEGTDRVAAVDRRGRLLSQHGRPAWAVASKPVLTRRPGLSASAATQWAALGLGLNGSADIQVLKRHQGATQATDLSADDLSQDDIPAKLAYLISEEDRLQRTWNIVLRPIDGRHWWNLFVDAETGEILRREDWMHHDTYNVFPSPLQSALDGARVLTTDAADAKASPFGWHDTDGVAGAEFNDTQGNNVRAQEDSDGDNFGGLRPDGGAARTFDSPVDLSAHPSNYQDAAVTNLFYWANFLHDVLYHNGFDEAAGNFQEKNYGLGGVGGDALRADAQDGAETNNAQFGAPIDGFSPRMEMFLFVRGPGPALQVQAPAGIAGAYPASDGSFGGETNGLTGDVVLALDDPNSAGPTTTDACSPLTNTLEIAGKVALVDRGVCLFIEKVATAQTAGAIGIIIANNAGNGLVNMSGDGRGLSIPAIFIGQSDGALLKGELANGLRVTLTTDRHRDSSFDNGIVIHEYGHGLTNRLTGGPFNSGCLDVAQSEGMGEGCDWLALVLTARTTDHVLDRRTVGNFSLRQSANGPGLRSHPYSRDLSINPLSFADISTLPQPHGIGEVWAATLWDLYWGFVGEYGFDPNFYSGSGGNNRLLQLVIDALKLQTCDPTFVQARDAILTADLNGSQGVNHCLIWESFARRGIGASALAGASNGTTVTEAFDLPLNCQTQCGDRARQPGEQCDDGNAADFDGCTATCRFETAYLDSLELPWGAPSAPASQAFHSKSRLPRGKVGPKLPLH